MAEDLGDDLDGCPAASSIVAVACCRSWNRIGGSPARVVSAQNRWLIQLGRSGVPSSRVNTRPESVQAGSQAMCSASWVLRQAPNMAAVPGRSAPNGRTPCSWSSRARCRSGLADVQAAPGQVEVTNGNGCEAQPSPRLGDPEKGRWRLPTFIPAGRPCRDTRD